MTRPFSLCMGCLMFGCVLAWQNSRANDTRGDPCTAAPDHNAPPAFFFMLTNDVIRAEVKLSAAQRERVDALHEEFLDEADKLHDLVKHAHEETPNSAGSDSMAHSWAFFEERTRRILSSEQAARLEQLRLQGIGVAAVFDQDVQAALELTEQQKADARRIVVTNADVCRRLIAQAPPKKPLPAELVAQLRELRSTAHRDVLATLTLAQQERLKTILGPTPDFDLGSLRFRLVRRQSESK